MRKELKFHIDTIHGNVYAFGTDNLFEISEYDDGSFALCVDGTKVNKHEFLADAIAVANKLHNGYQSILPKTIPGIKEVPSQVKIISEEFVEQNRKERRETC